MLKFIGLILLVIILCIFGFAFLALTYCDDELYYDIHKRKEKKWIIDWKK